MFLVSWLFLQSFWIPFDTAEKLYNLSSVNIAKEHIWPKLRYNSATAICEHVQSQLADPYSLQKFLDYHGKPTSPLWIAIKRYHFKKIRTTDGDVFEGFPDHQIKEVPGVDCGVYHSQDQLFDEKPCNMDTDGYICEYNGDKPCPQGALCMKYTQDRLLAFITFKSTWFMAHDRCRKDGGRLVNLTPDMAGGIKAFTKGNSDIKSHYLTGLIRSGWNFSVPIHIYKDQRTNHILGSYQWDKDQPDPGEDKSCAVLKYKIGYVWEAVSCDREYGFICLPPPLLHKATGVTREIRSEGNTENPNMVRNTSCGYTGREAVSSRQFQTLPTSDIALISITVCTLLIVIISFILHLSTYMSSCRGGFKTKQKPTTQPFSKWNKEEDALLDQSLEKVSEDLEQNVPQEIDTVKEDVQNFRHDTDKNSDIFRKHELTKSQTTVASLHVKASDYKAGSSRHNKLFCGAMLSAGEHPVNKSRASRSALLPTRV